MYIIYVAYSKYIPDILLGDISMIYRSKVKNRQKSFFLLKLRQILVSIPLHYLQIHSAEVEFCNEYFHMTKIIRARNIQTVRKLKAKPWSHRSCPRSELLVLGFPSLIPDHRFCFVDFEPHLLGPGS